MCIHVREVKGCRSQEGAKPEKTGYLCSSGLAIYSVHSLGASIDSMSEFLFHVSMGLSYFPDARKTETEVCIKAMERHSGTSSM
jgi:hypothetical protein